MLSGSLLIIHGDEAPKVYVKYIRQWLQAQKEVQYPVLITGSHDVLVKDVLRELSDVCYNTTDDMTLDKLLEIQPQHYSLLGVVGPRGVINYHVSCANEKPKSVPVKPVSRITSQPYQYPLHLVS